MDSQPEKVVSYGLMIILFIVAITCYAAFPHQPPDEPIRIMLKSAAGNVLFDHKEHTSEDGYGFECVDCHHLWEDDGSKPEACRECHEIDSEDPIKIEDAFHQQCKGCHEDDGTAPFECFECHIW